MKEKSFKRLSRVELVEIIYQLQIDMKKLQDENTLLKEKLEKKELKISQAGSIAQAVVGLTEIFEKAQETADYYLEEVRKNCGIEEEKPEELTAQEEPTEVPEESAEPKKKPTKKSALKQRKKLR